MLLICEDYLAQQNMKYHTLKFATELIFCNDLKSNAKIPLTFSGGNQGNVNILVSLQKDVIALNGQLLIQQKKIKWTVMQQESNST